MYNRTPPAAHKSQMEILQTVKEDYYSRASGLDGLFCRRNSFGHCRTVQQRLDGFQTLVQRRSVAVDGRLG